MAKKKWYDTWWGLLWTLSMVDANPGRGLQVFMEVDEELQHLTEFEEEEQAVTETREKKSRALSSCPAGASGKF